MISVDYQNIKLHVGDTIRVHSNVVEGNKTRVQMFEGLIISLSGRGENQMVKVRRIGTGGMGVERSWPLNARSIVKIDVVKNPKNVRRAKLYYLRQRTGKQAVAV